MFKVCDSYFNTRASLDFLIEGRRYRNLRYLFSVVDLLYCFHSMQSVKFEEMVVVHLLLPFLLVTSLPRLFKFIVSLSEHLQLTSQNPYVERFIGRPHVITIDVTDMHKVEEAMKEALSSKVFSRCIH